MDTNSIPTPPKGNRFPTWLKSCLIIFGIIVILGIIGELVLPTSGSKSNSNAQASTNKQSSTSISVTPTPAASQSEYKVGNTISIKQQTLRVNSVDLNYQPNDGFTTPNAGHQFVVVNVTLKNNGSESVDFNEYDFKIQDSQGAQTQSAFVGTLSNELNSGSLAPNGTVTGDIPFEVQTANMKNLKLLFTAGFWDQQTVTIDLN